MHKIMMIFLTLSEHPKLHTTIPYRQYSTVWREPSEGRTSSPQTQCFAIPPPTIWTEKMQLASAFSSPTEANDAAGYLIIFKP